MQWAVLYQPFTASRGIWGVIIVLAIIALAIYAFSRSAAGRRTTVGNMDTGTRDIDTHANAEAQRAYRERTRDDAGRDQGRNNSPPDRGTQS